MTFKGLNIYENILHHVFLFLWYGYEKIRSTFLFRSLVTGCQRTANTCWSRSCGTTWSCTRTRSSLSTSSGTHTVSHAALTHRREIKLVYKSAAQKRDTVYRGWDLKQIKIRSHWAAAAGEELAAQNWIVYIMLELHWTPVLWVFKTKRPTWGCMLRSEA